MLVGKCENCKERKRLGDWARKAERKLISDLIKAGRENCEYGRRNKGTPAVFSLFPYSSFPIPNISLRVSVVKITAFTGIEKPRRLSPAGLSGGL